jgi:hypothetical protein
MLVLHRPRNAVPAGSYWPARGRRVRAGTRPVATDEGFTESMMDISSEEYFCVQCDFH